MLIKPLVGEEVRDSARVVPRSMVIAFMISGAQTMAASIVILFSIGDITTALETPTKYPIIQIFFQATGSKAATTVMMCAITSALVFAAFGSLASASRLTWAFARDRGLPFSKFLSHVS